MNPLIRSIIWLIESSVHCTMFDHRPYTKSRIPCPTHSIPVAIASHPAATYPGECLHCALRDVHQGLAGLLPVAREDRRKELRDT